MSAAASSSSASSASTSSSIEPFSSGSVVTTFTPADLTSLLALESSIHAKDRANDPDALQQYEERLLHLSKLVSEGTGDEAEWLELVEQQDHAIYQILVLMLAYLPLSSASFHTLLQTLYTIATLDTPAVYTIICAHPSSLDKLLSSIMPELPSDQLATRLRFLDTILVAAYGRTDTPKLSIDLDDVVPELLGCLAVQSQSDFGLACSSLLLLNSIDTKRTLHRLLLAATAEVSQSPTASTSSSSVTSPSSSLTTASLSRFSQELITLINAGRLPPTWVEEEETTSVHSGVDTQRRNSVEDLYASHRTVTRAAPDRVTDCDALTSATLNFLSELFHTNTALSLLYTTDIQVLIEVLVRKLADEVRDPKLTLDYLLCLNSIVSWNEYAQYKQEEILELCTVVQINFKQDEMSEAEQAKLTQQEYEEYETKLAIQELAEMTTKKLGVESESL